MNGRRIRFEACPGIWSRGEQGSKLKIGPPPLTCSAKGVKTSDALCTAWRSGVSRVRMMFRMYASPAIPCQPYNDLGGGFPATSIVPVLAKVHRSENRMTSLRIRASISGGAGSRPYTVNLSIRIGVVRSTSAWPNGSMSPCLSAGWSRSVWYSKMDSS